MGRIGVAEIAIIILIIIVLFGAKKLPGLARSIAQAIKEFRKESNDTDGDKK